MPDKPDADQPDWVETLYTEGADEQPPATLDAAIREAARSHGVTPWYRDPRRLTGLAAAASFVIVVLIGFYEPGPELSAPEAMPTVGQTASDESTAISPDSETVPTAEERTAILAEVQFEDRLEQAEVATQNLAEPESLEEAVAPRQALARKRETPEPAGSGRSEPATLSATAAPRDLPIEAQTPSPSTAADAKDTAALEARLIEACGPLPAPAESRRWEEDEDGLYLVIEASGEHRYFRCGQDPASTTAEAGWYEISEPALPASEQ